MNCSIVQARYYLFAVWQEGNRTAYDTSFEHMCNAPFMESQSFIFPFPERDTICLLLSEMEMEAAWSGIEYEHSSL